MPDPCIEERVAHHEDGITGYVVLMDGDRETGERRPVEIVCRPTWDGFELSIDREVTLAVSEPTTHVSVFSDQGAEMMRFTVVLRAGDSVTLHAYPVEHGMAANA